MHRTKLPPTLAALLLAGLLVAACADPGADGGGTAAAVAASTSGPPSTVPDRRTEPTKQGAAVTVTGTVRAGVEPGCLLLEDQAGGRFLLVGGDRARLSTGSRVAITGRVDRGLLSTCQQGEPLVVASIEAAP